MIHLKDGNEVLDNIAPVKSRGTGDEHWGSSYFGPRYSSEDISSGPQSLMTQMYPGETILPHYHPVPQFQIFPEGSGTLGKSAVQPLTLQYKDHSAAYGPLTAGPLGLTFISLRNCVGDSHPVYIGRPGYKDKLKPSKRRNWVSPHIPLSTAAVLQFRKDVVWESIYDPATIKDELSASLVRIGSGLSAMTPEPTAGGGCYLFVANGELEMEGKTLPRFSMVYLDPEGEAAEMKAGRKGLEILVMQFPKDDVPEGTVQ
jgi:hypothetical protein